MAQAKMKPVSVTYLYQTEEARKLLEGVTLAAVQQNIKEDNGDPQQEFNDETGASEADNQVVYTVSDKMECLSCGTKFEDRSEQTEHYKSDWHRFNLKQKLKGLNYMSEDQFEDIVGDDLSSISGSESDDDDSGNNLEESAQPKSDDSDDEMTFHVEGIGHRHPRVFFRNSDGELLSIFRCVLHGKRNRASTQEELLDLAKEMPSKMKWAILLTAGGHFAGAVLEGDEVIAHKTFHRYVIRAKRGTVQSTRDKQGSAPKSGGATLRRYNEAALTQEIQELLVSWKEELKGCDRIFIKSPSYNRNLYFNGKNCPIEKSDRRIRLIPFVTRRPTFSELKRVHEILAEINSYGAEGSIEDHIKSLPKKTSPHKTKSQSFKPVERERRMKGQTMEESTPVDSSDMEETEITLEVENLSLDFGELREFEGTKKPRRKKKNKEKPQKQAAPSAEDVGDKEDSPVKEVHFNEKQYKLRNALYSACKMCDLDMLKETLQQCTAEPSIDNDKVLENNDGAEAETADNDLEVVLNEPFGDVRHTLLHIVASAGFPEAIEILMEAGCDPSVMDVKRMVSYNAAKDKETRQAFRRFMGKYPDKYDYATAKIPSPLTVEMENAKKAKEAERRKAQKKARQEKMKEKKEEDKKQRDEEKEKKRYLSLSDREKRALAAERRLVSQMASSDVPAPSLSRCFQCGADITGKVPFEYLDNRFCTPKCLKEHRFNSKPK